MEKMKCGHGGGLCGGVWVAGWLFTLGFLHLTFWYGVLAIIIWPYYVGVAVAAIGR